MMNILVIVAVVLRFGYSATVPEEIVAKESPEEPQLCPEIIRYNMTFWIEHFSMTYMPQTGMYVDVAYMSEEMTTDLPPMYPAGASRAFAMHAYLLLGPMDKMWLVRYPSDQIMHWYQGGAARLYVFHPTTGEMERRTLNARNVVTVVEAGYWVAVDMRSVGEDKYVLLGCTMAPATIDEDMDIAKPGDVSSTDKRAKSTIARFTRPMWVENMYPNMDSDMNMMMANMMPMPLNLK